MNTVSSGSVQATVGADGFEATIGDVVVRGDANVAPVGTKVEIEVIEDFSPSGVFENGIATSAAIEVFLGDGMQPESEIVISLPVSPVSRSTDKAEQSTAELSEPFAIQEHNGTVMTADFEYDPVHETGTIRTEQLSLFGFIQIGLDTLVNNFAAATSEFFDLSVTQPECYSDDFNLLDREYSLTTSEVGVAWPCFSPGQSQGPRGAVVDGSVSISVTLSAPGAWMMTADTGLTRSRPSTLDLTDGVLIALLSNHPGADHESAVVIPRVTTHATFASVPNTVKLSLSAPYTVVWSVLSVAANLIPFDNLEGLEQAQCLADVADAFDDAPQMVKALTHCIAQHAGAAGTIFGLLSAAPAALATNINGIIREATGTTTVAYTLESAWHPSNDSSGSLAGTWTGDIDQPGAEDYTVRVGIRQDADLYSANVSYPQLDCTGTWEEDSRDGNTVLFTESIKTGSRCVPEVTVAITPLPGGALGYFADYGDGATGVLQREDEDLLEVLSIERLLHEADSTSEGPGISGQESQAWVFGRPAFHSTTQWVSCTDVPSRTRYDVESWDRLHGEFILRDGVPESLRVEVTVTLDGVTVIDGEVGAGDRLPLDTSVASATELVISARTSGECGSGDAYGVLHHAYLDGDSN